ncbi:MAG: 4'-phosphopantetheinyl transferase superfamily protein [Peptostreptococcus sp.]|uniref:4'-phosphopantetheinyl transferase family protein n=1 Tax=Peptostreptococcus sp. TaxID=1262 RepID=UPI000764436E|nr:4'-phosphopantetheinyl transferase superfamily protein [Peptostreptococcus sp.]KXA00227.1 4'-phosphopantetheinyl transferase family protein [Anaerococcus hydrogenalis]MDU5350742.1 4'-phosphopantetheinyl transferase superfamily protein [Peptostreptococcus sp.]
MNLLVSILDMNIRIYEYRRDEEYVNNIVNKVMNGDYVVIKIKTNNEKLIDKIWFNMSNEVLEEANRYHRKNDKINHIVTREIVKKVIDASLSREDKFDNWLISDYGKPYIKKSNIKFNISHTRGCVLVAFSKQEIGVDVEFVDVDFKYESIINDFFSANEVMAIGNDITTFYKYWVSKEARLKQTGLGITKLKEVEIIEKIGESVLLYDHIFKEIKSIKLFKPYKGYIACVSCS